MLTSKSTSTARTNQFFFSIFFSLDKMVHCFLMVNLQVVHETEESNKFQIVILLTFIALFPAKRNMILHHPGISSKLVTTKLEPVFVEFGSVPL